MTEGGIEGVPSSRPGNYSESTEHTKYSQSVLCSTRAAQCFQRQKECGGLRNGADFSNTAGRNPYRGHLIHKMCFTEIVCFSSGGVQEKAHISRIIQRRNVKEDEESIESWLTNKGSINLAAAGRWR